MAPTVTPTSEPTVDPTAAPTVHPSSAPTASPTVVCVQWVLGTSDESCAATCSAVSRTCKSKYFKDVTTSEALSSVVSSSIDVRNGVAVGSAEGFCTLGVFGTSSVGSPSVTSYVLHTESGDVVRNYCAYPPTAEDVVDNCHDSTPATSHRRFCPCVHDSCDSQWYLGYTAESCTTTCDRASATCDGPESASITTAVAFAEMVETALSLEIEAPVGSVDSFCVAASQNLAASVSSPAAFTISATTGVNATFCTFPAVPEASDCDTTYAAIPAQRFCNCKTGGRRRLEQQQQQQQVQIQQQLDKVAPAATAATAGRVAAKHLRAQH
jgi:hypothetical protein